MKKNSMHTRAKSAKRSPASKPSATKKAAPAAAGKKAARKDASPDKPKSPPVQAAKKAAASAATAKKAPAAAAAPVIAAAGVAAAASPAVKSKFGRLLQTAMSGLSSGTRARGVARAAVDVAAAAAGAEAAPPPVLPVAISTPRITPQPGEKWNHYKQRVADALGPVAEWLRKNAGLKTLPSYCTAGLSTRALEGQMQEAAKHDSVQLIELDTPRTVTLMDDVPGDIEHPFFLQQHPALDGTGVRVAVLDSGIDLKHPWLTVAASVETCGESVDIPGAHGTHVAGSIASRDSVYRGVAPGITLINVKVLDQFGRGTVGMVTRGIDAALDQQADVVSMSLGWNHLPTWSQGGHGWSCPDGKCELCTAVNNAVQLDGVTVVAAAGNEHRRAQVLRDSGMGDTFDSEISCPGLSSGAITVGAITKQTFLTADFSSRGLAASGLSKPDLAAPGVNITSCAPARRDAAGNVAPGLTRGDLSRPESGTSMATPIVAAVVALIIQRRRAAGLGTSPAEIRQELLSAGVKVLASPALETGAGRLNLAAL
jgi:hypothetical protein